MPGTNDISGRGGEVGVRGAQKRLATHGECEAGCCQERGGGG